MALTEKSTLVTAPNGTRVSNYVLRVSSKVDTNELVVNNKADELEKKIEACYGRLNTHFKAIAEEYRKCASQSVKGDKIVSSLKKVATNCENQGKYCLNRKKQLNTLYKKDQSERYTTELNDAVDGFESSVDDLSQSLDSLDTTDDFSQTMDYTDDLTQSLDSLDSTDVDFTDVDFTDI